MTHEEIKGSLSAYHDGELGPAEAAEVAQHLRSCAGCAADLAELETLSSGLKETLAAPAPAGLKARALAAAAPKGRPRAVAVLLAGAAAALVIGLMALLAAKRFAPAMFAQIQGMINAASSTLGSTEGGN